MAIRRGTGPVFTRIAASMVLASGAVFLFAHAAFADQNGVQSAGDIVNGIATEEEAATWYNNARASMDTIQRTISGYEGRLRANAALQDIIDALNSIDKNPRLQEAQTLRAQADNLQQAACEVGNKDRDFTPFNSDADGLNAEAAAIERGELVNIKKLEANLLESGEIQKMLADMDELQRGLQLNKNVWQALQNRFGPEKLVHEDKEVFAQMERLAADVEDLEAIRALLKLEPDDILRCLNGEPSAWGGVSVSYHDLLGKYTSCKLNQPRVGAAGCAPGESACALSAAEKEALRAKFLNMIDKIRSDPDFAGSNGLGDFFGKKVKAYSETMRKLREEIDAAHRPDSGLSDFEIADLNNSIDYQRSLAARELNIVLRQLRDASDVLRKLDAAEIAEYNDLLAKAAKGGKDGVAALEQLKAKQFGAACGCGANPALGKVTAAEKSLANAQEAQARALSGGAGPAQPGAGADSIDAARANVQAAEKALAEAKAGSPAPKCTAPKLTCSLVSPITKAASESLVRRALVQLAKFTGIRTGETFAESALAALKGVGRGVKGGLRGVVDPFNIAFIAATGYPDEVNALDFSQFAIERTRKEFDGQVRRLEELSLQIIAFFNQEELFESDQAALQTTKELFDETFVNALANAMFLDFSELALFEHVGPLSDYIIGETVLARKNLNDNQGNPDRWVGPRIDKPDIGSGRLGSQNPKAAQNLVESYGSKWSGLKPYCPSEAFLALYTAEELKKLNQTRAQFWANIDLSQWMQLPPAVLNANALSAGDVSVRDMVIEIAKLTKDAGTAAKNVQFENEKQFLVRLEKLLGALQDKLLSLGIKLAGLTDVKGWVVYKLYTWFPAYEARMGEVCAPPEPGVCPQQSPEGPITWTPVEIIPWAAPSGNTLERPATTHPTFENNQYRILTTYGPSPDGLSHVISYGRGGYIGWKFNPPQLDFNKYRDAELDIYEIQNGYTYSPDDEWNAPSNNPKISRSLGQERLTACNNDPGWYFNAFPKEFYENACYLGGPAVPYSYVNASGVLAGGGSIVIKIIPAAKTDPETGNPVQPVPVKEDSLCYIVTPAGQGYCGQPLTTPREADAASGAGGASGGVRASGAQGAGGASGQPSGFFNSIGNAVRDLFGSVSPAPSISGAGARGGVGAIGAQGPAGASAGSQETPYSLGVSAAFIAKASALKTPLAVKSIGSIQPVIRLDAANGNSVCFTPPSGAEMLQSSISGATIGFTPRNVAIPLTSAGEACVGAKDLRAGDMVKFRLKKLRPA